MSCCSLPLLKSHQNKIEKEHPCFAAGKSHQSGRIHLAVAPHCNISCNYCVRKFDCVNESRPGVTSRVISPDEAIAKVREAKESPIGSLLNVVGIAGPGDPLANESTFRTLELVRSHFPKLLLCISTNGLMLPEKIGQLKEIGISHLTVTLNALDAETGSKIYSYVDKDHKTYIGTDAAKLLIENQLEGIRLAVESGMAVKVNSVVIPGINETSLLDIAETIKAKGVEIHNIMPLIPQGKFRDLPVPTKEMMQAHRRQLSEILPQMTHCKQCRADAIGLL